MLQFFTQHQKDYVFEDVDTTITQTTDDGVSSQEDEGEYDVVKKRRLMMEAMDDGGSEDDSPEALARFEDFEQSVMEALTVIHEDDKKTFREELIQWELDMANGVKTSGGGVYIARCDSFPSGIVKIGATRRQGPSFRLYELSRCVPTPFLLVAWIPTAMPFNVESDIHAYFDAERIKAKDAGTEFFNLEEGDIDAMIDKLRLSPQPPP